MFKYITNITAQDLLNYWFNAGLVPLSDNAQLESFILSSQQQEKELLLYMRILVGIGAFIASFCFIGFLSISQIINFSSEANLIFGGLLFIAVAIFLPKTSRHSKVKDSFFIQIFCFAMGVGKTMFVIGFAKMLGKGGLGITLSILLITTATYHLYHISIDRFLSTLAFLVSLFLNIITDSYFAIFTEIALNLFFFILIILAGVLFTYGKTTRTYTPLAYAIVFSLCIIVIYFTIQSKIGPWNNFHTHSLIYINAILTFSLVGLIGWAAGNIKKLRNEPLMVASFGAILLGIISAPGVIFSICLIVLSYAKHERLLLVFAILLLPMFIFLYYYNLDINLMAKSQILMGSGMILLAGRCYLVVKKLDN